MFVGHVFIIYLGQPLSLTQMIPFYNACFRLLLVCHARPVARTVADRTSDPWMTLEIKQAKVLRRLAERKGRESVLTLYQEIYIKQRVVVLIAVGMDS